MAKEGNTSRQLWTSAEFQCVSQNLSRLRTRRPIVCLGNSFSVDVMIHARERKFLYNLVDKRFVMRLETKGITLLHTRALRDQF